jgi:hypothetical protein
MAFWFVWSGIHSFALSLEGRARLRQQIPRRAPGRRPPRMGEVEQFPRMHAEGLSEPEKMGHLQPGLTAEDPGEILRIQPRPFGDLLDREARKLDQRPDQLRQPARFLLIEIGHGESIMTSRDDLEEKAPDVPDGRARQVSLADLLEAAGEAALERAGAILDARVP